MHKYYSILLILSILYSCNATKQTKIDGFENEYFGITGINCNDIPNPNAIDSKVGTLDCDCVRLNYDFGKYSYEGPLTTKEEFRKAFDGYHHIKFFENRMIDPKVNKLFLDSVEIIDVRRKAETDDLLVNCSPCNTTAVIAFKGDTYYYPVTLDEKQLDRDESHISFSKSGKYNYKTYIDNNENIAMYISPIQNRFKTKNCLSLVVEESKCTKEKLKSILNSAYIME